MLMRSWIGGANDPNGAFPLNNLPCGVFEDGRGARCGVAIGAFVLDVGAIALDLPDGLFEAPSWNAFMAAGPEVWARFRTELQAALAEGSAREGELTQNLVPLDAVRLLMPFTVSEYTDFYASREHASNVGTMFRGPENALPPNWLHMPIGYNGRASSVVVSGTPVRRPHGQIRPGGEGMPVFAPSARLDIELELGAVVGQPSDGPLSVGEADAAIFGYVLLNDWSARDIQAWEYVPLGPFQAKAFATSISPWIVPAAALEPFRVTGPQREVPLLDHLVEPGPMNHDIALAVSLTPEGGEEQIIARTNARGLYYSPAQQLAHHASSGCPMRVGDLLGSGTISGAERDQCGSLLEMTWGGERPLTLADGSERRFIEDGDTLALHGHAQGKGYRIGFGICTGTIRPA